MTIWRSSRSRYFGLVSTVNLIADVDAIGSQLLLNGLEQLFVDDRLVFAIVNFVVVGDFAEVHSVGQQRVQRVLVNLQFRRTAIAWKLM